MPPSDSDRTAAAPPSAPDRGGLRSVALAVVTLLVAIALPYGVPGLERFRLLSPLAPGEGFALAPPPVEASAEVGEVALPPADADGTEHLGVPEEVSLPARARELVSVQAEEKPPVSLVGGDQALSGFFEKLALVEQKQPGAIARVALWGDSNVASDLVSSVLRRALQKRFGDAGHGYVLLTRTSKRYFHNDVRLIAAGGWGLSQMTGPLTADNLYGLGATSFRALGKGAFAKLGTAKEGTFGRSVSRIGIPYLEQPGGAGFEVLVDGVLLDTVSAEGDAPRGKVATYRVPDGEHEVELRSTGTGARVFGVWLERDGPGVVVDALGVTNSKIRYLLRIDERFFAEQIEQREVDLLMFNFGVNGAREGEQQMGGLEHYEASMGEVLARMRRHHPTTSCLVVSPGDAAAPVGTRHVSFPLMTHIVAIQERVAVAAGCAFWNMREAMGGEGAMGKWRERGLGEEDLLHPTNAGATLLGRWLYLALMERYTAFVAAANAGSEASADAPQN